MPSSLKKLIAILVYLSVAVGVGLLVQIYGVLPSPVFYSILGGWFAYLIVAILVWRGHSKVYPAILVLALLTLLVSLPQPAHYTFISGRQIVAALTFIVGSALQVCLIVAIVLFLIFGRD